MKLHFTIIDRVGNVQSKGLIEGTEEEVLKSCFYRLVSDERSMQWVKDAYNLFDLDGKSAKEVMRTVELLLEADDDNAEDLFLTEVTDDLGDFFEELRGLFNADVGADFVEMSEEQTTVLVKIS